MARQGRLSALLTAAARILRLRTASGPSNARRESNDWLRRNCGTIRGNVVSIGSGDDSDGEGGHYRAYFASASSYTTSEVCEDSNCDLVLDVRAMPLLGDGSVDCVFCSGVLEHVDDFHAGLSEITRILADGGTLLLGVPFRQAVHMSPNDYWRFTEFGIRYMLRDAFDLHTISAVDALEGADFPATYWVKAVKRRSDHAPSTLVNTTDRVGRG